MHEKPDRSQKEGKVTTMTTHTAPGESIVVGEGMYVAVSDLRLDGKNPRFRVDADDSDQVQVAVQLANKYDALEVARSIARNGFHAAEPPAVLDNGDGTFTVLEGNRRVTALKGLLDPELSGQFADKDQWSVVVAEAAQTGLVPESIPVVVYADRESARPLLIGRHITGPKKWEPMQQDRYIHDLVNGGNSFQETAALMDKTVSEVKTAYRNYRLVTVDVPRLGLTIPTDKAKYTVLGNVWVNRALRQHGCVADTGDIRVGESSLAPGTEDADAKKALGEVLLWVLGTDKTPAVLEDSRQIVKLAQVVSSETGIKALRSGKSLKEALQQVSEEGAAPIDSARRMLTASVNSLRNAAAQLDLLDDDEKAQVAPLLAQLGEALGQALEAIEEPAETG